MKRTFQILLGLCATVVTMAGCTQEVSERVSGGQDDAIHLDVTTTRAPISTITDMHPGFRVFAAAGDISSTRNWYPGIDGTNNHVYSDGQWDFQTPVPWPTDSYKYPMTFYAWYPSGLNSADGFGLTANPAATDTELFADVTIKPTAAQQLDILASKATVAARPVGGNLVMTFEHIFSKIDFGVIPGREVTPEILSLAIINVGDTRTYDFVAGDWTSTQPDLNSGAIYYEYYGNFWDYQLTGTVFMSTPWSPRNGWDEVTATPFYNTATTPTAADAHLMLMPQTSPVWDPSTVPNPGVGDGATVTILYRMTNNEGTGGRLDEVGFASARNHPDFTGSGYEGPLYVMAGFPLPADANGDFTWIPGKGYIYNVGLGTAGSSNGYLMYTNYWDENGNPTIYRVIGGINDGEPLNDGVIHVTLDVGGWDDQQGGELPGWVDPTPIFADEAAPYILYWDSAAQRMQVGSWNAVSGGKVTTANQLFFQAASVVGFLNAGDGWDNTGSQIMFNPTVQTDAQLAASYLNIPDWTNSVEATTPAPGYTANGFISSPNYHYKANVFAGYGDPCKLAGLTEEQVKAGVIDNGKWVMARWDDVRTGYTAYGTSPGTTTPNTTYGMAVNGATDTFLPASGWRNYTSGSGGSPASIGVQGWYWSSKPMDTNYITTLRLDGSTIYYTMAGDGNLGIPVRCIGVTQYPADVTADANGSATVSLSATGNTNAKAVRATQGQSLTFTATPAAGYVFAGWSSTRFTLTDEQKTKNPLSLSMPGSPIRLTASFKEDFKSLDVTVNGVIWSGRNAATTGTFEPTAVKYADGDFNRYYNWTEVSANNFVGPCPDGWRVPTDDEYIGLKENATSYSWADDFYNSGINGMEVVTTGGTLFFPASGAYSSNAVSSEGTNVLYRTSSPMSGNAARSLVMVSTSTILFDTTRDASNSFQYPVRCVRSAPAYPVSAISGTGGTAKVTSDVAGVNVITEASVTGRVTFTATPDTGSEFTGWTATGITLTDVQKTANPLTITMPSNAVSLTASFKKPFVTQDVTINGLTWSGSNVAASGTFASTALMYDGANQYTWAQVEPNNFVGPCPAGWRVPSEAELWGLIENSTSHTYYVNYERSGINGLEVVTPDGTLFFAASGYRYGQYPGQTGYYRTSTLSVGNSDSRIMLAESTRTYMNNAVLSGIYSVRCVQDLPPTPNPVGEVAIPSADGTYTTVWAKTNLKAAGVFADNETDYGVIFQWGRNRAYTWASAVYANDSDGDDTSGTKGLIPSGADQTGNATWPASTDPCPRGWRVPTRDEYSRLVAVMTDGLQQNPRVLSNATYGSLAFPAAGLISVSGTGSGQSTNGGYWSNTQAGIDSAYDFRWTTTYNLLTINSPKVTGYSVRCARTL